MAEMRFGVHPEDFKRYDTDMIREQFLIPEVMKSGEVTCVYSMHDRMITMGISPGTDKIALPVLDELTKADFFLERRELGIINIGGPGEVEADGETFKLNNKECLYIGRGTRSVTFTSEGTEEPAEFFINSCPAHANYPTTKATVEQANRVELGAGENANKRTIFQYIHETGIQSCQLVMGYTTLSEGSIWNTFPPHTHYRRMEVYCYFDLPEDQIVMHFMGDPEQTRHIVMKNKQAVISPEWSIHAGAGTASYSFIWAMAGENKSFTDMDGRTLAEVK